MSDKACSNESPIALDYASAFCHADVKGLVQQRIVPRHPEQKRLTKDVVSCKLLSLISWRPKDSPSCCSHPNLPNPAVCIKASNEIVCCNIASSMSSSTPKELMRAIAS